MKIDPIVIHDAANKRVEGGPEPADEMGEENDSLMGLRSRDDLSRRWKTVADFQQWKWGRKTTLSWGLGWG